MFWLGACSADPSPLIVLDKDSVNHEVYIKEVLSVILRFGNKVLDDYWADQQDGASAHTHKLTQKYREEHSPSFVPKDRWSANSFDLTPLDYCIWNELVQTMD